MATVKPDPSNGGTALTAPPRPSPADPALVYAVRPPLFFLAKYR